MHEQDYVKVNARVDRGVKGIVSILSEFPKLETVESCEGDDDNGPWVCFRYGEYWNHPYIELVDFVLGHLAPHLRETVGDDATVKIQATPSGFVFGELSVRPRAAQRVEVALGDLSRDFNGCRQHHNSGCCGDIT